MLTSLKLSKENNLITGVRYFAEGIAMLMRPELRTYIIIPLAINFVLFLALMSFFISYFSGFTEWSWNLPAWLEFLEKTLKWLAWILLSIILVITYSYSFNVITNIIAAPFYGRLAQKTEELVTGVRPADEPMSHMIPRTLGREFQKVVYFIGRGILVLLLIILLSTLFVLGALAPVVGAVWGAWSMAIQYVDYPADNHQTPFRAMRKKLRKPFYSSIGFGGAVLATSIIPFLGIFAPPAAVIGGTLFWIRELREAPAESLPNKP